MKFPLSLHTRIALVAVFTVSATIWATVHSINLIVTAILTDNIDAQLDTQIEALKGSVNGANLDVARLSILPQLRKPEAGWGWSVEIGQNRWSRGQSLTKPEYPKPRVHFVGGIYSGEDFTREGAGIHIRRYDGQAAGQRLTVIVTSPFSIIDHPVQAVNDAVRSALLLVFLVLVCSTLLELRVGLQPLRKLGKDLALIRAGEAVRLPERQPMELREVANEVNSLIERNGAALEGARIHAANLAHSIKTPLSTLLLQLEMEKASLETRALVNQVSDRVAHHLNRARADMIGISGPTRSNLYDVIEDVKQTVLMLRRGRQFSIESRVTGPCFIAVDEADLSELVGNLVENATRYARHRVVIEAVEVDRFVRVRVEDDGTGIPEDQQAAVLRPGVRLDELADSYGFGLAIVRELVELYGGGIELANGYELGGLSITLVLPRS